jgi:N-acetylmuramoyl-L-alanine amidase
MRFRFSSIVIGPACKVVTQSLDWIVLGFLWLSTGVWADVKEARLWHAPDHSRLVFDLTKASEHRVFTLSNPSRVVIDLDDARLRGSLGGLSLSSGPVLKIRHGKRNQNDLRVVLDLRESVSPKSFLLKPNPPYGHRLVLDLYPNTPTQTPSEPKRSAFEYQKRDIVIAIDAGHGGEDPGAVGHGGVYEKDIVLKIARELESLLRKEKGYKPVMVRTGDYYIPLRARNKKARDVNADLLVSIHADAFKNARAQGSSVYAISPKGATSEVARWLANTENRADLIGGVGGVTLDDKDDILAGVLLDLSQTATMSASLAVGDQVLKEMGKVGKLHKKRVEQAQFVVLKSPDVPSILVEAGFITSPYEARKLKSASHRRALARSIYQGVTQYFYSTPPPGSYVAWLKKSRHKTQSYVIASGDTLSDIAKRHNTSLSEVKRLNELTNDKIRVGQILKIPSS